MKIIPNSLIHRLGLLCVACLLFATTGRAALLQIVVDNDFAILTGTDTSVLRLVYQNDQEWPNQISAAASFDLTLNPGETTIYILGMGGGGEENISGKINNININTLSLTMSGDLRPFLAGYNNTDVVNASYVAQLTDVQTAFPTLTFSSVSPTFGNVPNLSGFGLGYAFADATAVLLKVAASDVNVSPIPEPGTWAAMAVFAGGAAWARWRRRKTS